jgi:hypothetical protein
MLKYSLYLTVRYTIFIWGTIFSVAGIYLSIGEDQVEREFQTPHEWWYMSRLKLRNAKTNMCKAEDWGGPPDWVTIIQNCDALLKRLEDPEIDGKDVKELMDEPLSVADMGRVGKDITGKSENWRRGYYETMMIYAAAAEHLEGWVRDKTRNLYFPPELVIGDSNPNPKPIPPGYKSHPKEEECEDAWDGAENVYLRILTTRGFTAKQKMDAALACGLYLDYKQLPEAAERMYEWGLSLALELVPESSQAFDPGTFVLKDRSQSPPANLLTTLTAIATHKARIGDRSAALPIFLSLLRARRSLSPTEPPKPRTAPPPSLSISDKISNFFAEKPYPPPPLDGTSPPWRSPQEICEEAALELYIGEILYSLQGSTTGYGSSTSSREEGLSWTRDAVDIAEEQLRKLGIVSEDAEAKKTCKECLGTGLDNWAKMVARLARDEEEAKKSAASLKQQQQQVSSVFGAFWSKGSGEQQPAGVDRWAAENRVVDERRRRTRELLEDLQPESIGWMALFRA